MDQENYGPDYRVHLLEQYKKVVDLTELMAARRDRRHHLFLSINTALFALLTGVKSSWLPLFEGTTGWILPGLGVLLCILWYLNIRSMRSINEARFVVINLLEKELPASPFKDEWELLEKSADYIGLSKLEQWVPVLMAVAFVAIPLLHFIP